MNDTANDNDIAQKLSRECGTIEWQTLKPHSESDVLIIVQGGLDIITAGVAIARDDQKLVKQWLSAQSLIKPTAQQCDDWEQQKTHFKSVVVAPFVLMQRLSH